MMIKNPSPSRLRKVPASHQKQKTWLRRWVSKIARAFGLDAVQANELGNRTWLQSWVLGAISYRGTEQDVGMLRCASTADKNRAPAPAVRQMPGFARICGGRSASRGDTIVEVMISTAILAVVLATAYTTSTHSLQSGLNAKYRDQALTHARAQIELIKTADNQRPPTVDAYKLSRPFCINPADARVQEVDDTTKVCALPIGETNPDNQSIYSIVDNYSSASKTFTATVSWQSANSVPNQTTLYYKAYGSFVSSPGL